MSDNQNTIVGVQTSGALRSGICVHGPLIGKRVVSMGGGPWMPAGDVTSEEMKRGSGAAFGDFWEQAFGSKKGPQ